MNLKLKIRNPHFCPFPQIDAINLLLLSIEEKPSKLRISPPQQVRILLYFSFELVSTTMKYHISFSRFRSPLVLEIQGTKSKFTAERTATSQRVFLPR